MEICTRCKHRNNCVKPCKAVERILRDGNKPVMERLSADRTSIMMYPQRPEIRFTEIEDSRDPDGKPTTVEDFSNDDKIQFSSDDYRLRKTAVFIDRYFNRISAQELAEKFDVPPNTIVCMYRDAVAQIEKIVAALDSRKKGLKAVKGSRFSEHQQWFLLNQVFGYSTTEVAAMFDVDRHVVDRRVRSMSKRWSFDTRNVADGKKPIEDPPLPNKLTREAVTELVDQYRDQGLSVSKAAARIAQRWSDHTGRPTHHRAIDSKYWKHRRAAA